MEPTFKDKSEGPYLSRRTLLGNVAGSVGAIAATSAVGELWTESAYAGPRLSGPLTISNWPYYINPKVNSEFEARYHIKVNYLTDVNSTDGFFAKIAPPLAMGRNPDRDLVILNSWIVRRMVTRGWLEPLDYSQLPNVKKNLLPQYKGLSFDPTGKYSVPWASSLTGLAYNISKTNKDIDDVNALFDPAYKGHVGLINDMRTATSVVMLGMGVNPAKATYSDLQKACQKIKDNIKNGQIRQLFGNDYVSALARGDIWVTTAWSGDIAQLNKKDIKFTKHLQGYLIISDYFSVPIKAPHFDAAMAWLNFVYDPRIYAQVTDFIEYLGPVAHVQNFARKAIADNPLVFPTKQMAERMFHFRSLDPQQEEKWNSTFDAAIGL